MLETDTFSVALEPSATLPKPRELEEAESCRVDATPVPFRAMATGEFAALLTRERVPGKVPAKAGINTTLKEEEPPGAIESGRASPDKVKPVPLNEAWVIVSVEDPVFLAVSFCVLLVPVMVLPKLTLVGVTDRSGCTPVPVRETVAGELVAVLVTPTAPETVPAEAGVKATLSEKLCPAVRVSAPEKPLTLNPVPETVTDETVTEPVPVLVKVKACDARAPTS